MILVFVTYYNSNFQKKNFDHDSNIKFQIKHYSYLPNKRVYTSYLILVELPPCTILFGPTRLFDLENFSNLHVYLALHVY